jgi:hypothetical protein
MQRSLRHMAGDPPTVRERHVHVVGAVDEQHRDRGLGELKAPGSGKRELVVDLTVDAEA